MPEKIALNKTHSLWACLLLINFFGGKGMDFVKLIGINMLKLLFEIMTACLLIIRIKPKCSR